MVKLITVRDKRFLSNAFYSDDDQTCPEPALQHGQRRYSPARASCLLSKPALVFTGRNNDKRAIPTEKKIAKKVAQSGYNFF